MKSGGFDEVSHYYLKQASKTFSFIYFGKFNFIPGRILKLKTAFHTTR
jgi:hypothetical protein